MFQMCGVFAEFERAMIVERVNSGLARAKAKGVKLGGGNKKDGKRSADEERWGMSRAELEKRILRLYKGGTRMVKIGKTLGVGTALVQRILWSSRALSRPTSLKRRVPISETERPPVGPRTIAGRSNARLATLSDADGGGT
jgi:DNA invertase Pin-like site-specific DNA recombinase